jgi:5'-phosphate synthase pdxT subunit
VCAGAILLSTEILSNNQSDRAQASLGAIPLRAHRNFYGSQRESFEAIIKVVKEPDSAHRSSSGDKAQCVEQHTVQFIRAPLLEPINGQVTTVAFLGDKGVLFAYKNVLAASFHSELSPDPFLHQLFMSRPAVSTK